jgi:excisionase family DNA binding protein
VNGIPYIERFIVKREKPFLNLNEASDYLGLSKHSIYSYTSRGVIPHYKTGRKIYFSIEELNKWILNKENKIRSMDEIESLAATKMFVDRNSK